MMVWNTCGRKQIMGYFRRRGGSGKSRTDHVSGGGSVVYAWTCAKSPRTHMVLKSQQEEQELWSFSELITAYCLTTTMIYDHNSVLN